MSPVLLRRASLVAVGLLWPVAARAQGPTVTLELDGPGSQWTAGVLRCGVGNEVQLSIRGLDADGNRSILEKTRPVARSSDPRIASAVVPEYSAYILNVVCRGDGQARVQVTAGEATTTFAAMVGTARDVAPAPAPIARTPVATTTITPATTAPTPATTDRVEAPAGVTSAIPKAPAAGGTRLRLPASTVDVTVGTFRVVGLPVPATSTSVTVPTFRVIGLPIPASRVSVSVPTFTVVGATATP